jgi:monoamine oxidase
MSVISRRDFVRTAALAGAGAAIQGCSMPARPPCDVVVLGAGMAGMTAARELAAAKLDVVVIEARDRVGGRMESIYGQAPHGLEVGAQMVHGSRAPTWQLIHELGIKTRPLQNWTRWEWSPADGFTEPTPERQAEVARRLDDAYHAYHGDDIPYQRLVDRLKFAEQDLDIVNENALSWSAEPDEVSLQAAMEDSAAWDAYLDRNYQVVGGYSSLAKKMAEGLGDRVRLSSVVTRVLWQPGKVRVAYLRQGREERLHARRAVVTLPIGILQTASPAFDPALPGWKRRAIDALRMGRVVVIHFLFDDWFWRQAKPGLTGWRARGGRISFWDPHPQGKGMPALEGWITGRAAQELSDLGEKAGLDRALGWIEEALPGSGARSRVKWSAFRDWIKDPYSLGSYSYTLPGGTAQRAILAAPVQNVLYFAGEATQAAPHYQTVHGAYLSGRRVAREIFSSLGVDVSAAERTTPQPVLASIG